MTIRIEMPQLSSEDEGATLATWLVSVGDRVEMGDVIAELETDKSTVELEAPASGTIEEFVVPEGAEGILPGALLGTLKADKAQNMSDASGVQSTSPPTPAPETAVADVSDAASRLDRTAPRLEEAEGEVALQNSTPLARRAAVDRGVDLKALDGSGPGGRVLEEDVLRSASGPLPVDTAIAGGVASETSPLPTAEVVGSYSAVRLSAMRKTIARRMTEAKQQVPHFYLRVRCSMDAVLEVRARLNRDLAEAGRETKISVNDFVLRAAGLALREVPEANVSFAGDEMHWYDAVDIAVAVATEGGLVTPVIREADRKGLTALAGEVRELALAARSGKLRPEQYQGGSFTISNLGMYGIETVYPILNPPQACILGVGAAEQQPVVRDGEIVVGSMASLTLAADHRAVDGAVAARLLAALRDRLEDPLCMIL